MNLTDYLQLSELKIFKNVCESVPKDLNKPINLLTIKDGVLYAWDFANNCVLTLNVKAARSRTGDNVSHQSLLPVIPVLFKPEFLVANDDSNLLIVAGSSGVLVMELPSRYPPYGAFERNKELVYCKSHSLDERLFLCSELVRVRQVRFHPGSPTKSHIFVLTSDNILRLYNVENSSAVSIATYQVGQKPTGLFPGTKTPYLQAFGEIAVDFDFGSPTIEGETKEGTVRNLLWPAYVLRGNGSVFTLHVPFDNKVKPRVTGPLQGNMPGNETEACAIISIGGTPEVFCLANSNGTIYHCVLLQTPEDVYEKLKKESSHAPSKDLICFESVELELGLTTSDKIHGYTCPIFLHKDDSRSGRYFATHSAGIHSVLITCLSNLQQFSNAPEDEDQCFEDIFVQESKPEYLVCTKTAASEKNNPVVGFALYYEPTSLIAILGDGKLVSLAVLTAEMLPEIENLTIGDNKKTSDESSPLKKMLKEPFDQFIQNILKNSANQPILKLAEQGERSQKECLELVTRASQVFKDHFENHTRAREELEKRVKALQMMKDFQLKEIQRMNGEKQAIQQKAEDLAEKYEDIKDKQDVITKRCERLLILVTQKNAEPSDAEEAFFKELGEYSDKAEGYTKSIEKLKLKMNYQKLQINNWKEQEAKKVSCINERHAETIKTNLKEMGTKIADMVKLVREYKEHVNIK